MNRKQDEGALQAEKNRTEQSMVPPPRLTEIDLYIHKQSNTFDLILRRTYWQNKQTIELYIVLVTFPGGKPFPDASVYVFLPLLCRLCSCILISSVSSLSLVFVFLCFVGSFPVTHTFCRCVEHSGVVALIEKQF